MSQDTTETRALTEALNFAKQGFRLFPLRPGTKRPISNLSWPKKASADEAKLRAWATKHPGCNFAIATGKGLLVVDADGAPGLASLESLEIAYGLPQSFRVKTPSGGAHVYLASPENFKNFVHSIPDFPGIDIRSDGGYVVAPGSVFNGKTYEAVPGEIEPAGQDIERFLISAAARQHQAAAKTPAVELDLPNHIEMAVEYLSQRAPEAVEGDGGNATTYRVAAQCRDFGLSQETALELMLENWNEQKAFPAWLPQELATIVGNAYRYASGGWGATLAAAEFEAIDIDVGEPPVAVKRQVAEALAKAGEQAKRRRLPVVSFAEAISSALDAGAEPLIDGVLDQGTVAVLYGPSNVGKTFVAYDMSAAIAAGQVWNGHATTMGAVLYLATEGGKTSYKRLLALAKRRHLPPETPIHIVPCTVDLFDPKADCQEVMGACREIEGSGPVRLVVVDTLARAMAGGDENSGKDMGQLVRNIDRIRAATGATVLIVHHTGKDAAKGMRGHSSLLAAIDTDFEVLQEGGSTAAVFRNHKQRDLGKLADLRFSLEVVDLGADDHGRPVSSCAVHWLSEFEDAPLAPPAQALLDTLREFARPASLAEWVAAHVKRSPRGSSEANQRKLRKLLVDAGRVIEREGLFEPFSS
ncbi:AAA family ATPase [Shinella sp. CPCC 100929]|uniref:AAA family ATPase n=1 Tax=Shinella lacus TaxID=2654216 RepID=A0ABT1R8Z6_9HYPH|nr:AAA family ATPase [Shinella lacus]MCQ4631652.1 AAA family ATPase [Shinella lacus]